MRILNGLIAATLLLSSTISMAATNQPIAYSNQEQMLKDLDFIQQVFQVSYAPFDWKIERFQWDLENETNTAKQTILSDPSFSVKRFQNIIKKWCQATKDYHVLPQFYSTAKASLPFQIQSAAGRYFVSETNLLESSLLDSFPLSIGDEILTFDGKPIHEMTQAFMKEEIGSNYIGTDQALAEFYLTHRGGSYGQDVPKGKVEVTYRKPFSQKQRRTSLKWDYHPEVVTDCQHKKSLAKSLYRIPPQPARREIPVLQKPFITPHCKKTEKRTFPIFRFQ